MPVCGCQVSQVNPSHTNDPHLHFQSSVPALSPYFSSGGITLAPTPGGSASTSGGLAYPTQVTVRNGTTRTPNMYPQVRNCMEVIIKHASICMNILL